MTAGPGQAPDVSDEEGWDEAVLVWNATVARIPAPGPVPRRRRTTPKSKTATLRPDRPEARRGAERPQGRRLGPAER
jgi:hypothetical protein